MVAQTLYEIQDFFSSYVTRVAHEQHNDGHYDSFYWFDSLSEPNLIHLEREPETLQLYIQLLISNQWLMRMWLNRIAFSWAKLQEHAWVWDEVKQLWFCNAVLHSQHRAAAGFIIANTAHVTNTEWTQPRQIRAKELGGKKKIKPTRLPKNQTNIQPLPPKKEHGKCIITKITRALTPCGEFPHF